MNVADRLTSSYAVRIALVALVYAVTGFLGQNIAIPPDYVTVIWPAAGIAVAALLLYGHSLWPGVLIGSLIVNTIGGRALGVTWMEDGDGLSLLVTLAIAVGSTVQALVTSTLLKRFFGAPVDLSNIRDAFLFAALGGPLSCLVAASVGTAALYVAGFLPSEAVLANWTTWWLGDVVGVFIILPLALVAPWRGGTPRWKGRPLVAFKPLSLIALVVPLVLTFFAWKLTSELAFEKNRSAFAVLAEDSQQALLNRIESYKHSLDGGAGLFHASQSVTAGEWRAFVDALRIKESLPGINGIGLIEPVEPGEIERYEQRALADGHFAFSVHPDTPAPAQFVIKYIEPLAPNLTALGLNIAFENNRYSAAVMARDTGKAVITKRILLVQDATKSAGFLLLRPFYAHAKPVRNVTERRLAFRGWVYAPFVGNRFMANLTASQGVGIDISVYDGDRQDPEQLIYSSRSAARAARPAIYQVSQVLPVMEQEWTVVWESTPSFERSVESNEPVLILAGGLVLTMLLGLLLYFHARREQSIQQTVELKTHAIAARERENRAMVDTAVVGFLLLDKDGTILSANHAVETIFGYSAAELHGHPLSMFLDEMDEEGQSPLAAGASDESERTPASLSFIKARNKAGKRLYLDVQRNQWRTESGALRHTIIIRDVSVQRRVTHALEETERRWKHALEGAQIGVFDIDLTSGTSFVSNTWKEMLGFAVDEAIEPQAEWSRRVHPDDLPVVQAHDEACIDGRTERSQTEYRIRRKDGRWIWLRSDAIIIKRDARGVAKRMVGTQTDITELKVAEDALRATEERFRLAISNAPVGMAMIDADGGWLMINEALGAMLGYSQEELLDRDLIAITHPEDVETTRALMAKLIDGSAPTYQVEKRLRHKDGRALWCLFSVALIQDEGGKKYLVSHFQDINDRKEMDRVKSEFVATVSHELRTPLTSIRGSLGLIMGVMAKELPSNATRLLTIALKNCERLIELINDILDLEKITAGMMNFEYRTIGVKEMVDQSVEANQAYFEKFGVSINLSAPDEDYHIVVDPGRFQQVLSNLLSNAAKFSPKDGVIDVDIAASQETVRIEITDDGTGIPPEFVSKIFDRFSQADSSATREKGGTGLGLHIAKQIIEQMGGTIGFANVAGKGARFWVELPCVQADQQPRPVADGRLDVLTDTSGRLPRGLHVEDDDDFIEILSALLKGHVELWSARSLAEARHALAEKPFDFAVIDLALPDGNGLELLDELVSPSGERLPTIVLSAADTARDDERLVEIIVKSRATEKRIVDAILALAGRKGTADSDRPDKGEDLQAVASGRG